MAKKKQIPIVKIRHGLKAVGVSTLAGQLYCEKKVDLSFEHPEIDIRSKATDVGTEGHEDISSDALQITRYEFIQAVKRGDEFTLQESMFEAKFKGMGILGVPDLVRLHGNRCLAVLEFKFSRRSAPFIDRFIQAQLYGWLIQKNGLDTSKCICGICVLPPDSDLDLGFDLENVDFDGGFHHWLIEGMKSARKSISRLRSEASAPLTIGDKDVTLHLYRYDCIVAEKHLEWAISYWKNERDPIPTRRPAKCRMCPYNAAGVCANSLSIAHPDFVVRKMKKSVVVRAPW